MGEVDIIFNEGWVVMCMLWASNIFDLMAWVIIAYFRGGGLFVGCEHIKRMVVAVLFVGNIWAIMAWVYK